MENVYNVVLLLLLKNKDLKTIIENIVGSKLPIFNTTQISLNQAVIVSRAF